MNQCFWDPTSVKYHCFVRYNVMCSRRIDYADNDRLLDHTSPVIPPCKRHTVHISSPTWEGLSKGKVAWTRPGPFPINAEKKLYAEDYSNCIGPTPYVPSRHIIYDLQTRFAASRKSPYQTVESPYTDYTLDDNGKTLGRSNALELGITDVYLEYTRDLDASWWNYVGEEPIVDNGLNKREWAARGGMIPLGGLLLSPDKSEFWFYATREYGWVTSYIRRYAVRRNGFMSLYSGERHEPGVVTTHPIELQGDVTRISINYRTSSFGFLRAEILDGDENVVPGYGLDDFTPTHLFGNSLAQVLRWGSNGADVSGALKNRKLIRLRFTMFSCHLYSVRFYGAREIEDEGLAD